MEALRSSLEFLHRTAVVVNGASYRYADILGTALRVCASLGLPRLPEAGATAAGAPPSSPDLHPRVALMCDPGPDYVAGTFAAWMQRGVCVPLALSHPDRELTYVLGDAGVSSVLCSRRHAERMHCLASPMGAAMHVVDSPASEAPTADLGTLRAAAAPLLAGIAATDPALIIYTSGTTGPPKGALHTHASLDAQVRTLCSAWQWSPSDRILHALPLHHIHGIVNALYCALAVGATVEVLPKFSPSEAWARLSRPYQPVSLFMGVPTMYAFLLNAYDAMPAAGQRDAAAAAQRLRLAVSGSAACPTPTMRRWEEVSGSPLLERYGMTETGMILGNPLRGERRPGTVGQPFPGVQVRLAGAPGADTGEVLVRSEQLFSCYWGRPEATAAAFDGDGFFVTGDTASVDADGYFRLLGRTSVDVIKRGGHKISALQVESALLEHPAVGECAVVGLPHAEYGEEVAAVMAPKPQAALPTLAELRGWAAQRLPPYSLPTQVREVPALARNAMGKVNKKALRAELFPEAFPQMPQASAAPGA